MVKKLLLYSLFILLFAVFSSNAYAQTTVSTDSATNIKPSRIEVKEVKRELKETIQARREEAKEAIKAKREEFKVRLQTIKDEKKKVVVERIDAKLSVVNTKHVDKFSEILVRLQTFLDKISLTTTDGVDGAQKAIDSAKTAVENQSAKTYTITITTEANLRLNVGTVTSQLRKDLTATHKSVVDAKKAVQNLKKSSPKDEATSSANL